MLRRLLVVWSLVVLGACAGDEVPPVAPTAVAVPAQAPAPEGDPLDAPGLAEGRDAAPAARSARAAVAAPSPRVTFPVAIGPLDPGAPPSGLTGTDARSCRPCHAEIYREWRRSFHRQSWTDPMFQDGYRRSPHRPCRRCHAPLEASDAAPEEDSLAATEGVSCAVCHIRDGHVFGPEGTGADAHDGLASPTMATGEACAPCHQFNFPGPEAMVGAVFDPHEAMQDTVEEWRRSEFAATPCQSCHMPLRTDARGRRYRSHEMRVRGDPELMGQALEVEARAVRRGPDVLVTVTLRPGVVGHAVPTGDMFRALEVEVFPAGQPERRERRALTRHFGPRLAFHDGEPSFAVRERRDDRVGADVTGTVGTAGVQRASGAQTLVFRLPTSRSRVGYAIRHLAMPRDDAERAGVSVDDVVTPMRRGEVRVEVQ